MSTLTATRGAQWPLMAEFTFNFDDQMVPVSGGTAISGTTAVDFGKTNIAATVFNLINLPYGAVVVGGEWVTETAFDTAGYTITIGDSTTADRYLASADKKAAARTALTLTGYVSDGAAIRLGVTNTDVCTTGKATLRVLYTIRGRLNEAQTN
jgi:hypothetical protein